MADTSSNTIERGSKVSFSYGGSRRTGTVADVSMLPTDQGGTAVAYLIDVGARKVFVQGTEVTLASSTAPEAFDAVAEGVAYGRKKPRTARRR